MLKRFIWMLSSSGGRQEEDRFHSKHRSLILAVKRVVCWLTITGHGGENRWTAERVVGVK